MLELNREKMLEAMLFASGESVHVTKLAKAIGTDTAITREILKKLAKTYEETKSGILLHEHEDTYRLCTNPLYYPMVERLLELKPRRPLSQTLLETLAIVAFKQPVTKGTIEQIRGVNADHAVNKLMEYGLIEENGRLDAPGRPILFITTEEFYMNYDIKNLQALKDERP